MRVSFRQAVSCLTVVFASLSVAAVAEDYLQVRRGRLFLRDEPFAAVGVEKADLVDLFGGALGLSSPQDAARALDDASRIGFDVIRTTLIRVDAAITEDWPTRRRNIIHALGEALAACRQRDMKLVVAICADWTCFGRVTFEPPGRLFIRDTRPYNMFRRFVRDVVLPYRDDDTLLYWDILDKVNADMDILTGIVAPQGFTSAQLATFVRESALLVKGLDANHPVSSGLTLPAVAKTPRVYTSARAAGIREKEIISFLTAMHRGAVDIVSIQCVEADQVRLLGEPGTGVSGDVMYAARGARSLGKPLVISRLEGDYSDYTLAYVRATLEAAVKHAVPLVLLSPWEPTHQLREHIWPQNSATIVMTARSYTDRLTQAVGKMGPPQQSATQTTETE